jgi:ATP-dependent helicase HrpB
VKLATGTGARVGGESGVVEGEFLVALDVSSVAPTVRSPAASALLPLIRMASVVDREWLVATAVEVVHHFDAGAGRVRAMRIDRYDHLTLAETPERPDADIAAQLIADAWLRRGPTDRDTQLLRRLRFADHDVELDDLVRTAARDTIALDDVRLERAVPPHVLLDLERDAPLRLALPSGRSVALEYGDDGSVSAAVKLQELFGVADTPRIGRRRERVRLSLLAPNGRPVQITRDLRSFWKSAYQDVRKELRGRYPKHKWPEDPNRQ